jgi:hypothetical protein
MTTALLDVPDLAAMAPPAASPSIRISTGASLHLLAPRPEDWTPRACAHALSQINRFTGHTTAFYSVAQHCCAVHDHLPLEARGYGLLHDAHEWAVGDMSTPLARALDILVPGFRMRWATLKARHDQAIFSAAGLPWPLPASILHAVEEADARALATEQRDLQDGAPPDRGVPPWRHVIRPWPALRAAEEWLQRYDDCTRLGLLRRPPWAA